jgi:hypothetical protein
MLPQHANTARHLPLTCLGLMMKKARATSTNASVPVYGHVGILNRLSKYELG